MYEVETRMVITTPRCPECGEAGILQIPADGYDRWAEGALIQEAFPNLSLALREQLKTGYHGACWDTAFGPVPF
jgi:ribosomal protein S27AE